MSQVIELVLKANTSMLLQKKMDWYVKVYPREEYNTTFGVPFVTKDGMRAIKVTRNGDKH
jgi:hypothetical protein